MHNSATLKNELIFQYASGTCNLAKSLMASSYLFLNSKESDLFSQFENYCGKEFDEVTQINSKNLSVEKCITTDQIKIDKTKSTEINPINKFIKLSSRDI